MAQIVLRYEVEDELAEEEAQAFQSFLEEDLGLTAGVDFTFEVIK